jgi:hypothetical protein
MLVYGTPNGPALTQASWFRAEEKEAVKAAAKELKFSIIELQTDADRALAAGAHEGVLKGSGRMIVGTVSAEVYRRIEEYARKGGTAEVTSKSDTAIGSTAKRVSEQNMNDSAPAVATPDPSRTTPAAPATDKSESVTARETLRVGARVLAAYRNEKREFEGFWLANIRRIEPDGYTLEWFESPDYPPFKSRPQDIAVPHPEFRISGK